MSDESLRIRGEEAKQLLDNKMFKDAFAAVGDYIEQQAMACPPDDKERCARIIISKQLLQAVQREIYRHIDEGVMAEIRLSELEKKKRLMSFMR